MTLCYLTASKWFQGRCHIDSFWYHQLSIRIITCPRIIHPFHYGPLFNFIIVQSSSHRLQLVRIVKVYVFNCKGAVLFHALTHSAADPIHLSGPMDDPLLPTVFYRLLCSTDQAKSTVKFELRNLTVAVQMVLSSSRRKFHSNSSSQIAAKDVFRKSKNELAGHRRTQ